MLKYSGKLFATFRRDAELHPQLEATILAVRRLKRLKLGCAAMWRSLAVLLIALLASAPIPAQKVAGGKTRPAGVRQDSHAAKDPASIPIPVPDKPTLGDTSSGNGQEEAPQQPPPNIRVVTPPVPIVAKWPLHEQILWGATLVLVILGYAGVMIALRILKQIQSQSLLAEDMAQAARDSAQAACMNAQAVLNAQRPWLWITVGPSPEGPGHFRILATNRGTYPAEVVSTSDRIGILVDESCLPKQPEYSKKDSDYLPVPVLVMPGESIPIQTFARADLKWICRTEESLQRVQLQLDTIFIYGKVVYRSVAGSPAMPNYETGWCCRYIHEGHADDVVLAGPAQYRKCT